MKRTILYAVALVLCAASSVNLFSQSTLSNQNSDVIVDDQGIIENGTATNTDPQILFDLGFPGDVDDTCYAEDWEWRYRSMRLEPNAPKWDKNLFIGYQAGRDWDLEQTQGFNTFIGNSCGVTQENKKESVAVGYQAFQSGNASACIAIGAYTLMTDTGYANVACGHSAMKNNTNGSNNAAFGHQALNGNKVGNYNIAIGREALLSNDTGSTNIGIGHRALSLNLKGYSNIAIGFESLYSFNEGYGNIALGNSAFRNLTSDDETFGNIAIGSQAGENVQSTGTSSVLIGQASGVRMGSDSTSWHDNTFVGSHSGAYCAGDNNVAIGYAAGGHQNATEASSTYFGNRNVFVGALAGGGSAVDEDIADSCNVMIGYKAGFGKAVSGELWIDNTSQDDPLIWGDFTERQVAIDMIPTNTTYTFYVNGDAFATGTTWATSDIRLKKSIENISSKEALEQLLKLEGITYYFDDKREGIERPDELQYGFSAQDLKKVLPELVREEDDGFLSARYGPMDALFVEALRSIDERQDELQQQLESALDKINALEVELENEQGSENELEESSKEYVNLKNIESVVLNQNSPNPFAEKTEVTFSIPVDVRFAQIVFHDESGNLIEKKDITQRGYGRLIVYGDDLSSGVYTYSLIIDGEIFETLKMVKSN